MKEITKFKAYVLEQLKQHCEYADGGHCRRAGGCECEPVAEYKGHVLANVPPSCLNKHVRDFTGIVPGKQALPPHVVKAAKKTLVNYIWGDIEYNMMTDFTSVDMQKRMSKVLAMRRDLGHSLVIHGNPYKTIANELGDDVVPTTRGRRGPAATVEKVPQGKTLLASIIATEVMRLRLFPGHMADTYEWVSFDTIRSRSTSYDREAISDCQTADWLFVDDITVNTGRTEGAHAFTIDAVDAVFLERVDQNLPTVLVFDFDITAYPDLRPVVGAGIAKIVRNENTQIINVGVNK